MANMSDKVVQETCSSYTKRKDGEFPIILTLIRKMRMRAIVLWVKDKRCIKQTVKFGAGTATVELQKDFSGAIEQDCRRKGQKKASDLYLNLKFNVKLKSTAQ